MLCPATVSAAAAAAVWLLAVLGPGLSLPAEDNSESDFTLCSHCFYRQTPPQGASAGLRLLCHRLPRGQAFATLTRPTCDTAVYSAFHLSHGWTEKEGEELVTEEEDNIEVAVPALLRRGGDPSHPVLPTDSPLQHWDSTVTTLVQSSISPQCSTLGGDLYILTGAGGLGAAEDGDEECQMKPLWSAVCCSVPGAKDGFSMGLISETEGGERQVSMTELEEMLGVRDMFSEGCGGADVETAGVGVGLHSEGNQGNIEKMDSDASSEETDDKDVDSDAPNEETDDKDVDSDAPNEETDDKDVDSDAPREEADDKDVDSDTAGQDSEGKTTLDAQPEEADEVTQETSEDAVKSASSSEEQADVRRSGAARSESPESSAEYESVDGEQNSTSTLVYILSTTMSIIKAPLRPVVSKVTQLPGQVTYVLQEDLGVLSALPGDTYYLLHLLTSDLLSWMGSAAELVLGVGEACFFSVYYCTSSILGALMSSCHTGVSGMGTLAGDTVGVFGGVLNSTWWVTKFFGERLWEQSEGYAETMMSEMGGQAKAVGGGLGKLAWRSGNCVGNLFRLGWGLITGMVDMLTGAMREGYGRESE
ncbi:uncharacterized protein LOC130171922 [Seriola aureovittata]|uniref:uncharacterized protein LOC130171922 n=1 Tax=Seriola aureovittata TaxID=2871759 RepID=UPI0024BE5F7A|nr:uncharacterized protein LOC130171922 [Seriola aureovittata]